MFVSVCVPWFSPFPCLRQGLSYCRCHAVYCRLPASELLHDFPALAFHFIKGCGIIECETIAGSLCGLSGLHEYCTYPWSHLTKPELTCICAFLEFLFKGKCMVLYSACPVTAQLSDLHQDTKHPKPITFVHMYVGVHLYIHVCVCLCICMYTGPEDSLSCHSLNIQAPSTLIYWTREGGQDLLPA